MIFHALARVGYFFRPFRQGAYQHAPSIEERYVMRQSSFLQIKGSFKRFVRSLLEAGGR
jgi:hypothetical protein